MAPSPLLDYFILQNQGQNGLLFILGEKLVNILRKKININNKTDRNSCQGYQKNCQTPKK